MSLKQAYQILLEKWGEMNVERCMEYTTVFVFAFKGLSGAASVNKNTGVVRKFMPTDIPLSEYRAGKEVKSFK